MLTPEELERYARHIVLREVGGPGQAALGRARVLVIGAGGLGAPVLLYLAAAGVGTLGVIDDDTVALSNLQRQVIHGTPEIGTPKVESAAAAIARLNPHVKVVTHAERLTAANALALVSQYDIVADGSDNFATRYLVSDACYFARKPLVTAAVGTFDGTLTTIRAHERGPDGTPNPTYRCLFPEPPPPGTVPACAEAGILGALAGVLGSMMALEVIREIVGFGEGLVGRLLMVDARAMRFETLNYGVGQGQSAERRKSDDQGFVRARVSAWCCLQNLLRNHQASLAPHRNHGRALHHRPFVLAGSHDDEAIGLGALPRGAEAGLVELPGAGVLDAGFAGRLARHLAVGRERHRVFDVLWRRGGERLAVEERLLNVSGRQPWRRCGQAGRRADQQCRDTRIPSAHGPLPS